MGIISVRVDDGTEARLKREARAQGRKFSDFLRERLGGKAADLPDPGLERRMENMEKELRQLADGIEQVAGRQTKDGYFTRILILHSLRTILPDLSKEEIRNVFNTAKEYVISHWKRKEGNPS